VALTGILGGFVLMVVAQTVARAPGLARHLQGALFSGTLWRRRCWQQGEGHGG
jgi:hypothetical protein